MKHPRRRRSPRPPEANDAKERFTRLVRGAVARQPEKFLSLRGTVAIAVPGSPGWTIRFGSIDDPVELAFDARADLQMWLTPTAFAAFVDGTLDVRRAMAGRTVRVRGDRNLLHNVGVLFEPGGTPLQTLLSSRQR
jgi:hypothetical protein